MNERRGLIPLPLNPYRSWGLTWQTECGRHGMGDFWGYNIRSLTASARLPWNIGYMALSSYVNVRLLCKTGYSERQVLRRHRRGGWPGTDSFPAIPIGTAGMWASHTGPCSPAQLPAEHLAWLWLMPCGAEEPPNWAPSDFLTKSWDTKKRWFFGHSILG